MSFICLHLVIPYNIDHMHFTRTIFLFLKTARMDTTRLIVFNIPATAWLQAKLRHTGECCKKIRFVFMTYHIIVFHNVLHHIHFITYCCFLMPYVCHVTASLSYVKQLLFSLYWFVYQDFIWCIQNTVFFSVPMSQTIDHGRTHFSDGTMSVMACQINRRFIQIFVWANIKENIKARVAGHLWVETTGDLWIPSQGDSHAETVSVAWRHYVSEINSIKIRLQITRHGCQTSEFVFHYVNGTQYRWKPHDQM